MISCTQVSEHQSFKNSKILKGTYEEVVSTSKYFISKYNESLKKRIQEKFRKEFYFNETNKFNFQIVFSASDNTLVNIERDASSKDNFIYYYAEGNPQAFIQEVKLNKAIVLQSNKEIRLKSSRHIISFGRGQDAFITGITYQNITTPYGISEKNLIGTFNYKTTVMINQVPLTAEFPGISILFSGSDSKTYLEKIDKLINQQLNYEIWRLYTSSDLFRKALVHPLFKKTALRIASRKDRADRKIEEYPYWEFEMDLKEIRDLAKANGISDNYVDEMIKDSQYNPISGSLLYYYSSLVEFMLQWILIGLFFLILFYFYVKKVTSKNSKLFAAVLLAINGWIFSQKPEMLSFFYWIIPGVIFILTEGVLLGLIKVRK